MNKRLCIFGEVLFDIFPDGKRVLGGAPFNVAWHLQAFGQAPCFISRVGEDAEGEAIRSAMQEWDMDTAGLQTDPLLPTGRVSVTFTDGEPAYDIVQPCAYDAIEAQLPMPDCSLLYHGSLALRGTASFLTLQRLRYKQPETVFVDVNLRAPWWQRKQVQLLLRHAHWAKLNADELNLLYDSNKAGESVARDFVAEYGLRGLVLTHGAQGAEVFTGDGLHFEVRPEMAIEVVDTVGAGDAFAAVFILGLRNDWPLDVTLQRAQQFASRVVGRRGATVSDLAFYQTQINEWRR